MYLFIFNYYHNVLALMVLLDYQSKVFSSLKNQADFSPLSTNFPVKKNQTVVYVKNKNQPELFVDEDGYLWEDF